MADSLAIFILAQAISTSNLCDRKNTSCSLMENTQDHFICFDNVL
jgi:hypothetical protein